MDKYMIIVGGNLSNKGAESMLFVTVDEIKRRFPEREIIVFSTADYKRVKEDVYQFKFMPLDLWMINDLLGGADAFIFNKLFVKKRETYQVSLQEIEEIFLNAAGMADISGYTLSSQWGVSSSFVFLRRIMLAVKYKINIYLMPQSFGPFEYKFGYHLILNHWIKKYLKFPRVIYAREEEGQKLLEEKYKLKNVKKSYDLVLLNRSIDLNHIYKNNPIFLQSGIEPGVGIVPNMRNFEFDKSQQTLSVYCTIINRLLSNDKKIYLIRHSFEDKKACEMIKNEYKNNERVILLSEDMNCFEFSNLIRNLDFLVCSRFHSIVHAYKEGIPCIVIGWAVKYKRLVHVFEQDKYMFDIRNIIDKKKLEQMTDDLFQNYCLESERIKQILENLQEKNIYDVIE